MLRFRQNLYPETNQVPSLTYLQQYHHFRLHPLDNLMTRNDELYPHCLWMSRRRDIGKIPTHQVKSLHHMKVPDLITDFRKFKTEDMSACGVM